MQTAHGAEPGAGCSSVVDPRKVRTRCGRAVIDAAADRKMARCLECSPRATMKEPGMPCTRQRCWFPRCRTGPARKDDVGRRAPVARRTADVPARAHVPVSPRAVRCDEGVHAVDHM